MVSIDTVQSVVNAPVTNENAKDDTLGQEDYLQLMTKQLTTQDPFQPMENGDFIAQMAQFSTVSGLAELTEGFNSLAASLAGDRVIQASNLIDRQVLVDSAGGGYFNGESLSGQVNNQYPTVSLNIKVYSEYGELVDEIGLGANGAGPVEFNWDGVDMYGNQRGPGKYRLQATALVGGEQVEMSTEISAKVQSVLLDSSGTSARLSLQGIGEVDMSSVRQIQ